MKRAPLQTAREAWGEPLPDWIETLAIACGRTSQAAVAKELGRSGAVVSQVLRRVYPAGMAAIEERVRGVYLNARIACPGLGEIAAHACKDWRAKAREFAPGNPVRVRMFRACAACPRNRKEVEE
jgi:hypothetical protein